MQFWKLNIVLVVLVFSFDHIRSSPRQFYPQADADDGVNNEDQGVDDSDEGVYDSDEGVNDTDERVNDADQGVDDAVEGVNDADQVENDAEEDVNDANNSVGDTSVEAKTPPMSPDSKEPACLQEHEEYKWCGTACPNTCYNYKVEQRPCTIACVRGCFCKKGYIRNPKDNTCIKPEQCPEVPLSDQCKPGQYLYAKDCNICYCYAEDTQGCTSIKCPKDTKMTLLGKPKQTLAYKKLRDTATGCVPGEKFTSNGCNCNCVIPSVMTCDKSCVNQ